METREVIIQSVGINREKAMVEVTGADGFKKKEEDKVAKIV